MIQARAGGYFKHGRHGVTSPQSWRPHPCWYNSRNRCIGTSPGRGPTGHIGLPRQHMENRLLKRNPVLNHRGSLVLFSACTPLIPWPQIIMNNGKDFTVYKNKRLQMQTSNKKMGLKNWELTLGQLQLESLSYVSTHCYLFFQAIKYQSRFTEPSRLRPGHLFRPKTGNV